MPRSAKTVRTLLLIFVGTLLSACFPVDQCNNCSPPQEAIAEMRIHGVTLTTYNYPFPETINTSLASDADYTLDTPIVSLDSYAIELVFSPPTDKSISVQPTNNEWDEHPYSYSFSQFLNEEYRIIKPLLPFNYSVAPTTDLSSQYGPIKIDNSPAELVLYGNHLLKAVAAIPENATHIELWHRQQRDDELTFVRRVALENLYGWRQYYQPYFDSISQETEN